MVKQTEHENKQKKKISPTGQFLWREVLVLAAAVLLCAAVYHFNFTPKAVAETYVRAVERQNWNKVYDLLKIQNGGEFMSKEAFVTAQELNAEDTEIGRVQDAQALRESNGFFKQVWNVSYRIGDVKKEMEVILRRSGTIWKVDAEKYLTGQLIMTVPEGTKLLVDHIEVDESRKTKDAEKGLETYAVAPIFGASHYVEVAGDMAENTAYLVTSRGKDAVVLPVKYNEETLQTAAEKAKQDLTDIFQAAAEGKDFAEVEILQEIENEEHKERAATEFTFVRDNSFGGTDERSQMQSYALENLEANAYTIEADGRVVLKLDVKGDYLFQSQNTETDYVSSREGTSTNSLFYVYEDSSWRLYAVTLSCFY